MPRPTSRVLALLELLQSGGTRTAAELADRLQVDERTVRRYVDHLLDLDVPVESVRGPHGGYRLGSGYRLPPLMLDDDEALAVLLGLVAARRSGLATASVTASETAAAKLRRVLPARLAGRLDALLATLAFSGPPTEPAAPDGAVLLAVADAARHGRPLALRHRGRDGKVEERRLHPYGLVAHAGRWYVTGTDVGVGEERTFRLDRVVDARPLPGAFDRPASFDAARRVLSGLARVPYRHEVVLRMRGPLAQIRARLPAGLAVVEDLPAGNEGPAEDPERWFRVTVRAERLDWVPALLASVDRPFAIDQPDELRDLVRDLGERLAGYAAHEG